MLFTIVRKTKQLKGDNRGQVLIAALLGMSVVMLALGLTADLGRTLAINARLKNALDAAALSAVLSAERYIDANVYGVYWDRVDDSDGGYEYMRRTVTASYTGKEREFPAWFSGWARGNNARGKNLFPTDYNITERWNEFAPDAAGQARAIFDLNLQRVLGASAVSFDVSMQGGRGREAGATVFATVSMPTILMGNFGVPKLEFSNSASAIRRVRQ